MSSPKWKLFHNDETLNESINNLRESGVSDDDIYILSHDNSHERRNRKNTDANKIGVSEIGVGTTLKNVFRNKGDKLRTKMKEIGLSSDKADELEEELDKGKTLLVVTNQDEVDF
ncbi:general stress protein [Alkalicoccus daliensis]|uniref:Heat induced stress protein YflT n=1 Tax=Alkalicoccus daliensis TaxID=745820 RepID=A0A1H0HSD4_9BACI|nr:general stress protein [Alkalicoccus daliensis]SDO22112.1 Heat induced stress protein YflT [Alkalicoccus daliensis]